MAPRRGGWERPAILSAHGVPAEFWSPEKIKASPASTRSSARG